MSADDYNVVRLHPNGGFTFVRCFESDDEPNMAVPSGAPVFGDWMSALAAAWQDGPEYGVVIHEEVSALVDPDPYEPPVTVDRLGPDTPGRWLVTTRGSQHVWDINTDGVLYTRLPGEGRGEFAHDGTGVWLTAVGRWPEVGATSFIWFDDPANPMVEQWRQSSRIRSITALGAADGHAHV